MSEQKLVVHPLTIIAHRAGVFSLGRLSGSTPALAVGAPDLVLLAQFLAPNTATQAAEALCSGAPRAHLPGTPAPAALAQRISQFIQARALTPADRAATIDKGALRSDDFAQHPALPGSQRLRLTRNFLIKPGSRGFMVRNTRDHREHWLSLPVALVLIGFAQGSTGAEVAQRQCPPMDTKTVGRIAAWLIQERLLVSAEDERQTVAAGDYQKQVPVHKASGPDWRTIEPDGRIPVYFVPHMENHFPLALGMIYSALAHWNDGELPKRYQLIPISYLKPEAYLEGPYRKFGCGVWLFSNYLWSLDLNLHVATLVKQHDLDNLTVHGGPSTPNYEQACREFMARHRCVDIAVHGEGEVATCEILAAVRGGNGKPPRLTSALSEVAGITFRKPGGSRRELVRTHPRMRMRQPDRVPSPYQEGVFNAYEARVEAAIVETNRGCPFKCTFCDWGSATNQKVSRFELNRVEEELHWVGQKRIGVLWIADANFGMLKRDLKIAETIVAIKKRYGYPREVVVNYTKNANERLAEIIRVFTAGGIISQGIISIQTTDAETLRIIDRENIKTEKYDQLIEIFANLGLPLSTDLMIGLPGITPQAFDRDLQRYIDVDVSVKAYPTQLLPNSPMAHPAYMEKHRIKADEDGYLLSCASYSREQLEEMKFTYHAYTVADGYGTLRHVLRFVQWEHGIGAMRQIHDLMATYRENPDRYPAIGWVLRYFSIEKCLPGGWRPFYEEIAEFLAERYQIARDSALEVVLRINEAVMPDESRHYPMTIKLGHDYHRYFADRRTGSADRPLSDYPPGTLTVTDPNGMAVVDFEYQQYDTHQFFWELHCPVSRIKSIAQPEQAPKGKMATL